MLQSKLFKFLLLGIISCILFSCGSQYRLSTYFKPEKMVPADFNPNKQILLIAEFPKKNQPDVRHDKGTDKIDKIFKEYYPYKYEIVSRKDILDPDSKYTDTSIYKYAALDFMGQHKITSSTTVVKNDHGRETRTTVAPSAMLTTHGLHFYDRNSDKNYPGSDLATSNFGEQIKEFVKVIIKAQKTTANK